MLYIVKKHLMLKEQVLVSPCTVSCIFMVMFLCLLPYQFRNQICEVELTMFHHVLSACNFLPMNKILKFGLSV